MQWQKWSITLNTALLIICRHRRIFKTLSVWKIESWCSQNVAFTSCVVRKSNPADETWTKHLLSHPFSAAAQIKHCCLMTTQLPTRNTDGLSVSSTLRRLWMRTPTSITALVCSPRQGTLRVASRHCTAQDRLFRTDAALLKARHGPSISLNS